jgi:hypothetical protein
VVNESPLRRIVQENPNLIPGGNNSWPDFIYLAAEFWITALGKKRVNIKEKKRKE